MNGLLVTQVLAALDQIQLQREGKISPPPIAISRNVRAAVDKARQQEEADSNDILLHTNNGSFDQDDEADDLDLMLDDDDSDVEDENGAIDLDAFFERERQMGAAQQQQMPSRARRR